MLAMVLVLFAPSVSAESWATTVRPEPVQYVCDTPDIRTNRDCGNPAEYPCLRRRGRQVEIDTDGPGKTVTSCRASASGWRCKVSYLVAPCSFGAEQHASANDPKLGNSGPVGVRCAVTAASGGVSIHDYDPQTNKPKAEPLATGCIVQSGP